MQVAPRMPQTATISAKQAPIALTAVTAMATGSEGAEAGSEGNAAAAVVAMGKYQTYILRIWYNSGEISNIRGSIGTARGRKSWEISQAEDQRLGQVCHVNSSELAARPCCRIRSFVEANKLNVWSSMAIGLKGRSQVTTFWARWTDRPRGIQEKECTITGN